MIFWMVHLRITDKLKKVTVYAEVTNKTGIEF